jgi:hypothetical protein
VYFSSRDEFSRSAPFFIEIEAKPPYKVIYEHPRPVLQLGEPGAFDADGVMPSCLLRWDDVCYLYYTGWNKGLGVGYRLEIGVAISSDGGLTFTRYNRGPLIGRSLTEPIGCAMPYVVVGRSWDWRMYYLSFDCWVDGEPMYRIASRHSQAGFLWTGKKLCLDYKDDKEGGLGRCCVLRDPDMYRMWYCHRNRKGYRKRGPDSYRIGYAESPDGIDWTRKDDEAGLDVSDEGWDSVMTAYPYVFDHNGQRFMMYNGNGFGQSGIGLAVLE